MTRPSTSMLMGPWLRCSLQRAIARKAGTRMMTLPASCGSSSRFSASGISLMALKPLSTGIPRSRASSISAAMPAVGQSRPKAHSSSHMSTSSRPMLRPSSRSAGTVSSMNCVR